MGVCINVQLIWIDVINAFLVLSYIYVVFVELHVLKHIHYKAKSVLRDVFVKKRCHRRQQSPITAKTLKILHFELRPNPGTCAVIEQHKGELKVNVFTVFSGTRKQRFIPLNRLLSIVERCEIFPLKMKTGCTQY